MGLIIRWAILSFAIFLIERILPGIEVKENSWYVYFFIALILALLNTFLKPVLKFLSCPLMVLTFGLFSIIINSIIFYLTSWISNEIFNLNFQIKTFWDAIIGSFLLSVINLILLWLYKSSSGD